MQFPLWTQTIFNSLVAANWNNKWTLNYQKKHTLNVASTICMSVCSLVALSSCISVEEISIWENIKFARITNKIMWIGQENCSLAKHIWTKIENFYSQIRINSLKKLENLLKKIQILIRKIIKKSAYLTRIVPA